MAGYIEKLGTGTKDLVADCIAKGLPAPKFVQEEEDFNTIIYRNVVENVVENVIVNVVENAFTLADHLHVTPRTIQRDLNVLQTEGFLRHEGPDKGGKWVIINF